jgi:hypothetical protein
MIYFHSYQTSGLVDDICAMNNEAKKTGTIILEVRVVKHHIMNVNLFRNGADFTMDTVAEFDGSDSHLRQPNIREVRLRRGNVTLLCDDQSRHLSKEQF